MLLPVEILSCGSQWKIKNLFCGTRLFPGLVPSISPASSLTSFPLYFIPQRYWVTWYSLKVLWCLKRLYLGLTAWEIPSLLRQLSSSAASLWNPSLTLPADLGLFFFCISVSPVDGGEGEREEGWKRGRCGTLILCYICLRVCLSSGRWAPWGWGLSFHLCIVTA